MALEAGGTNALSNLEAICPDCHNAKTNAESSGAAVADIPWHLKPLPERPIITFVGPLFSGKTDSALEIMRPGDKVVCVDSISNAAYGRPYHSGLTIGEKREILRTRNRALKDFQVGTTFNRCINICPAPSYKERQFWQTLSAELIVMPYDPDDAKRRAERELLGSDDLAGVLKDIDAYR